MVTDTHRVFDRVFPGFACCLLPDHPEYLLGRPRGLTVYLSCLSMPVSRHIGVSHFKCDTWVNELPTTCTPCFVEFFWKSFPSPSSSFRALHTHPPRRRVFSF